MEIGKFIKKLRTDRGLTQKELSDYANVSFSVINRIENGDTNVNLQSLNKILKIFGYVAGGIQIDSSEIIQRENNE